MQAAAERIPVAIASGRVQQDVGHFARLLGLRGPQVSDNGARLMDPVSGKTLSVLSIAESDARGIVDWLERDSIRYFAVDAGRIVRSIQEINDWRVTMITCFVPDRESVDKMVDEYTNDEVTAMGSRGSRGEWYVDFTHGAADKGYGARRFAEIHGIEPSQIMAIGDGLNDREMFEAVGLPVAMGHTPDDIARLTKHVTGSLEDSGVAQAIGRFVL